MKFIPAAFALTLALSAPAFAAPGAAAKPGDAGMSQTMEYQIYAGGINAVSAKMNIAYENGGRYSIGLGAATKGFLRALAPWNGTFESHGWRNKDDTFQPELHKSVATWRGSDNVDEYTYDRKGGFLSYTARDGKHPDKKNDQPDPALTKGTTDIMSAALAMLAVVGDGKPCSGSADIFDGARRFTLTFESQGQEELKASRYNVYQGLAEKCAAEVTPKGGKWYEKPRGWLSIQEQGRRQGMLPTVWIARLAKNGPAVPVKMEIKSDYGALFMNLSHFDDGTGAKDAETPPPEGQ